MVRSNRGSGMHVGPPRKSRGKALKETLQVGAADVIIGAIKAGVSSEIGYVRYHCDYDNTIILPHL
jgi:hypothetical protein